MSRKTTPEFATPTQSTSTPSVPVPKHRQRSQIVLCFDWPSILSRPLTTGYVPQTVERRLCFKSRVFLTCRPIQKTQTLRTPRVVPMGWVRLSACLLVCLSVCLRLSMCFCLFFNYFGCSVALAAVVMAFWHQRWMHVPVLNLHHANMCMCLLCGCGCGCVCGCVCVNPPTGPTGGFFPLGSGNSSSPGGTASNAGTQPQFSNARWRGRLSKWKGDYSLLAGLVEEAETHYAKARDVCGLQRDSFWQAGAYLGALHCRLSIFGCRTVYSDASKCLHEKDRGELLNGSISNDTMCPILTPIPIPIPLPIPILIRPVARSSAVTHHSQTTHPPDLKTKATTKLPTCMHAMTNVLLAFMYLYKCMAMQDLPLRP